MIVTLCVVFDTSTVRWCGIALNKRENDILEEYTIGHVTDSSYQGIDVKRFQPFH